MTDLVCPRCGATAGENEYCSTCGLRLAEEAELPTRDQWEERQAEGGSAPEDVSAATPGNEVETGSRQGALHDGSGVKPKDRPTRWRGRPWVPFVAGVVAVIVGIVIAVVAVTAGGGARNGSESRGHDFGIRVEQSFVSALNRATGYSSGRTSWSASIGRHCTSELFGIELDQLTLSDFDNTDAKDVLFHCAVNWTLYAHGLYYGARLPRLYYLTVAPHGRWSATWQIPFDAWDRVDPCRGVGCNGFVASPPNPPPDVSGQVGSGQSGSTGAAAGDQSTTRETTSAGQTAGSAHTSTEASPSSPNLCGPVKGPTRLLHVRVVEGQLSCAVAVDVAERYIALVKAAKTESGPGSNADVNVNGRTYSCYEVRYAGSGRFSCGTSESPYATVGMEPISYSSKPATKSPSKPATKSPPKPATKSPSKPATKSLPNHCSPGVSTSHAISCGIAANLFYEYYRALQSGASTASLSVWSPATKQYYTVDCSEIAGVSSCLISGTTEPDAEVQITKAAIDAYTPENARDYAAKHDVGPNG